MRRSLLSGLLLVGLVAATPGGVGAQTLKRFSTTRQFHGEVRLGAAIEFAGGTLNVGAGAPTSLYAMDLAYDAARFQPVSKWDDPGTAVTLGLSSLDNGSIGVGNTTQNQTADIQFSPRVDLDLSLAVGAAKSRIDLGGLRLSSLKVETGASQTEVRFSTQNPIRCTAAVFRAGVAELTVFGLGNSRCDRVSFEGGMGSVTLDYSGAWANNSVLDATVAVGGLTLRIPRAVGVTITTDQFLASFQPAGFTRQGNRYVSSNDATASRHLTVTLATSFGGVTVDWLD
ncbi:MAG: hypothetical protein R2910_00820 [Gemmatimonadales bacterium]|jgi:hypothetical protein